MQQGIHRASRPNFRLNYLAAAVCAALAANAPAFGDTILSTVEVTAERNAGSLNLDQPSTTGSRTGVTVRELPASIESVDSATIQERGDYTITATAGWAVTWQALGQSGTLPLSTRATSAIPVREFQSLVVG